jgi:hypothetical protein
MGVGERIGDLARDPASVLGRQAPLSPEALPQRLSLHKRHDIIEEAAGLAGVVEGQDVRMGKACRDLDFPKEPLGTDRRRYFGAEDLDRYRPVMLGIRGEVHGGHATAPDFTFERVASSQDGAGTDEHVLHASPR